jgi:hypothetical protein
MGLRPIIPNLQQNDDLLEANKPGTLAPMLRPMIPNATPAAVNLPSGAMPALPNTLRPLVTNPRLQQEQALQQKINAYENPAPQQGGFWHKLGHIAARIGNIAGDIVSPGTMAMIPGTDLNRALENAARQRELAGLQKQDMEEQDAAQRRVTEGAQAEEAQARAKALENPPEKPVNWQHIETDQGIFALNPETNQLTPLTYNGKPLLPKQPAPKELTAENDLKNQILAAEQAGDQKKVAELKKQLADLNPLGQQRIQIQLGNQAAKVNPATEREYNVAYKDLNDKFETAQSQMDAAAQAQQEINAGAVGQAAGTIKTLVALAGGRGSGVRITQAELNALIHARGIQGDFDGWVNKISGQGQLSDQQKAQFNAILGDVQRKLGEKQQLYHETLDKLGNAQSPQEIRKIQSDFRKQMMGGNNGGGGSIQIKAPNGKTYTFSSQDAADRFKKLAGIQ